MATMQIVAAGRNILLNIASASGSIRTPKPPLLEG